MKTLGRLLFITALFCGGTIMAQEDSMDPVFEKQGELITGTFYYEDGSIQQKGTYKDGKLHGKWVSYNEEGEKTALANYTNGEKTGKWFFWSDNELTEVDYQNNQIASVKGWKGNEIYVSNE